MTTDNETEAQIARAALYATVYEGCRAYRRQLIKDGRIRPHASPPDATREPAYLDRACLTLVRPSSGIAGIGVAGAMICGVR